MIFIILRPSYIYFVYNCQSVLGLGLLLVVPHSWMLAWGQAFPPYRGGFEHVCPLICPSFVCFFAAWLLCFCFLFCVFLSADMGSPGSPKKAKGQRRCPGYDANNYRCLRFMSNSEVDPQTLHCLPRCQVWAPLLSSILCLQRV